MASIVVVRGESTTILAHGAPTVIPLFAVQHPDCHISCLVVYIVSEFIVTAVVFLIPWPGQAVVTSGGQINKTTQIK